MSLRQRPIVSFLPAALAAMTDVWATGFTLTHQPFYGRTIVFLIVMFGAALLSADSRKWVRIVGFVVLAVGVLISGFSVGMFYIPALIAAGWLMVRDVPPPVQGPGPGR